MKGLVMLLLIACVVMLAVSSQAASWNALAQFNPDSNAESDTWQYGYATTSGGAFSFFEQMVNWNNWLGTPGLADGWDRGGNSLNTSFGYPCWVRNKSGADIDMGGGRFYADGLYCWPYPFGNGAQGVVRWKAPHDGSYQLTAQWKGCQNGRNSGVRIYAPSASLDWSSAFTGARGDVLTKSLHNISLPAGDYICFEANWGTDGSGSGDAVSFNATIFDLDGQARLVGVVKNDAGTPWPGTPVEGAAVDVVSGGTGHTTTAPDGSYSLDLALGTYTIRYSKDGYVSQDRSLSLTADVIQTQDVEMALVASFVSGVVRNAASTPWPDAALDGVTVDVVAGGTGSTTTAADGSYSLQLEPGSYTIRFSKDGYASQQFSNVAVTEGGTTTLNADLALAIGAVAGYVRHAETALSPGFPVVGATVEVVGGSATATTGQGGQYALLAPPGTYALKASKPGYASQQVSGVSLAAGSTAAQDFGLSFDMSVWDALRDFSGKYNPCGSWAYGQGGSGYFDPLPSPADWSNFPPPQGPPLGSVEGWDRGGGSAGGPFTYPDGYPSIDRVKTGFDIPIDVGGYVLPADRLFVCAFVDTSAIVKWTAPLSGTYTVNASFKPGSAAGVAVYSSSGGVNWTGDLTGATTVLDIPPTDITVGQGEEVFFEVNSGALNRCGLAASVKLNLGGNGMVGGTVRNSATTAQPGVPIAGASVQVVSGGTGYATTDDAGNYYLVLAPGSYTIEVGMDGYTPQRFSISLQAGDAPCRNVDLSLTGGTVIGVVKADATGPQPGKPLAGATVEVVGGSDSVTTEADGSYALLLPPGTYTLKASARGYFPLQLSNVTASAGGLVIKNLELALDPTTWDALRDFSGTTNPNGAWAYGYGSSSAFSVMPYTATWAIQSDAIHVDAGALDGWDRAGGNSLSVGTGYPCWMRNKTGEDFSTTWNVTLYTDRLLCYPSMSPVGGVLRWTAPLDGDYQVWATFRPAGSAGSARATVTASTGSLAWSAPVYGSSTTSLPEQIVTLAAGDTVDFEINDGGNGNSGDATGVTAGVSLIDIGGDSVISGVIRKGATSPDPGAPLAGARVELVGGSAAAITGSDGRYYLRVGPGTLTIKASAGVYAPATATVNVAAGGVAVQDMVLTYSGRHFDVSQDWSFTGNSVGAWTYGRYIGGPQGEFSAYTNKWGDQSTPDSYAHEHWTTDYASWIGKYFGPTYDEQNPSYSPPHLGWYSAGDVVAAGSDPDWAVARWTAPWSGTAIVHMAAYGRQAWSYTAAEIDLNHNRTTSLGHTAFWGFDGSPNVRRAVSKGTDTRVIYDGELTVEAGDTLDIACKHYFGGDTGIPDWSSPVVTTYFTVDLSTMPVNTLAALKNASVGDSVVLTSPVAVTAASDSFTDGSYYIEDLDRINGVKVVGGSPVALGNRITLNGVVGLDANGEKVIEILSLDSKTTGTELAPLGMGNKTANDADLTGLLVKVWGTVIERAVDGSYAVVDDGSGTPVRIALDHLPSAIRTALLAELTDGRTVSVTGVAALAKDDTVVLSAVRPRVSGDVRGF